MGYKSEAAFSRALVALMKKRHWFVQRIESGTTGNGVPDIWAAYYGRDYWFELKNQHSINPVSWRPGQQGWHHKYLNMTGRMVYTIVSLYKDEAKTEFAVIGHKHMYMHGFVPDSDIMYFDTLGEVLDWFQGGKNVHRP